MATQEPVAALGEGAAPSQPSELRHEFVTIGWLLFGGLALGVGWFVGVNRLWRSTAWSLNEKLLGTLVLPGGLLGAFYLAPRQVASSSGGVSLSGWSVWGALALVLPVASASVLVVRSRQLRRLPTVG